MKYIDKRILKLKKKELLTYFKVKQYLMNDNVYSEFLVCPEDYFCILTSITSHTIYSKYPLDQGIQEQNSFFICGGIKFVMVSKKRTENLKVLI